MNPRKYAAALAMALILFAIPALAKSDDVVKFDAPFAFRVGDASMPAGSYTVTQPDENLSVLLIEDANGAHATFVDYRPEDKDTSPSETLVRFKKYGNMAFLNSISVTGDNTQLILSQSKAEKDAAITATAEVHAIPGTTGSALRSAWIGAQPANESN